MSPTGRPQDIAAERRRRLPVYGMLVLLFVIWSNSFHAIGYFRREIAMGAMDLVTLRFAPVAPLCLLYCLTRRRELWSLLRAHGWAVLLAGMLAVVGYNLPLNWGQGRVPPATASLLISTNPLIVYLLALAFLGERLRLIKVAGLVISFLGVYGLLHVQHGQFGDTYVLYALVVLLAPLSWSLATVVGKPITGRVDPLLFTFAATCLGSIPYTATLILGGGHVQEAIGAMPGLGWLAWIHLSVGCTVVGYAIWFWALRHLPASSVAAFVFLNPPLTLLFGILWGTDTFHWSLVVFGSIVLGGVALGSGLVRPARSTARVRSS